MNLAYARELVLDGIFNCNDIFSAVLIWLSAAYSVVVFPEPVGPVTRMMP